VIASTINDKQSAIIWNKKGKE